MDPLKASKFCPLCGGRLRPIKGSLKCSVCGYHVYDNPKPTVSAIIENENGEILFCRRRLDPKKGTWDLPGGFMQVGEEIRDCLRRELKEELGLLAKPGRLINAYLDTYVFDGIAYTTLNIYLAATIDPKAQIKPADDIDECQYFTRKEIASSPKIAWEHQRQAVADYFKSKLAD